MKRIIKGVTYNTETATLIAQREWHQEEGWGYPETDYRNWLYQTRHGAFFLAGSAEYRKERRGEWQDVEDNYITPMTRDEAHKWVLEHDDIEPVDFKVFGEPPEASAEDDAGATIYLRIPTSLKERIEQRAKENGVSMNAWLLRCSESCLKEGSASRT